MVNLSIENDKIAVRFSYSPQAVHAIKKVHNSKYVSPDKGGPMWTVPLTLDHARQLRSSFGSELVIHPDLLAWGREQVDLLKIISQLHKATSAELPTLEQQSPKLAQGLMPFQRVAAQFVATVPNCLIADQPGLGKTREAIAGIVEAGLPGPYLVVAPKTSMQAVWGDHIEKVLDRSDGLLVVTGSKADREKQLQSLVQMPLNTWVVVNPEMIRSYDSLLQQHWSAIIIDECHKGAIRNPKTQTAKAMYRLKGDKKIAMSGTPIKNNSIDLYGVLHWLEPKVYSSKWAWADQWLHVTDNGFGSGFCTGCSKCENGIKQGMSDEFAASLQPYVMRRTKVDVCPELPQKQQITLWCSMDPEQAKQYDTFAEYAAVVISGENVTATSVLAELTRLKQFASALQEVGEIKESYKLRPIMEHSGKCEMLLQLLDERGILDGLCDEQVVVFSQFSSTIKALQVYLRKQGVSIETITGDTSQADRLRIQNEFQKSELSVLAMTTTAGGVAITLDAADTVVFFDQMWSPADMEQAEDRVHRVSRMHNVSVYHLLSKGTIDEYILQVLDTKGMIQRAVLDSPASIRLK